MKVFFDVGAFDGKDSKNFDGIVYAFEPVPEQYEYIKKTITRPNYNVYNFAVSNNEGISKFNIYGSLGKTYSSSLCSFDKNNDKYWPDKKVFDTVKTIEVPVRRLDNFIRENGINRIDYLHVDAQGKDLEVLLGLGEYITIVKEGVIEMPCNINNPIYEDQKYSVSDAITFLKLYGFGVSSIKNNDDYDNEVNIRFVRKR